MTRLDTPVLTDAVRRILDGPHLSVLATTNADGQAQTSVIFVTRDGDDVLFSTIKGRRKTTNMLRDPRVNLLVHSLPVGGQASIYATISGTVELTDDPDGSFHQVMYDIHMGGATPPPEPGAQRVIVRIRPQNVYVLPPTRAPPPSSARRSGGASPLLRPRPQLAPARAGSTTRSKGADLARQSVRDGVEAPQASGREAAPGLPLT